MLIWMVDMDVDGDMDLIIFDCYGDFVGCCWFENLSGDFDFE